MQSEHFCVDIDASTGGVKSIRNPTDPTRMNWTSCAENAPWVPRSSQWGLGFVNTGTLNRCYFDEAEFSRDALSCSYSLPGVTVLVERQLDSACFKERYTFRNDSEDKLVGADALGTGIILPFNDHYTSAEDVLDHRAHTHVWCGLNSSWIVALRMGGAAPHLGLVLTEGSLSSYSIIDRNQTTGSNTRGSFVVHPTIGTLHSGEVYTIAWSVFWHTGWDDFEHKASTLSPQYVKFKAPHYTFYPGEMIDVEYEAGMVEAHLQGNHTVASSLGETELVLSYGNLSATLRINVVPRFEDLVSARCKFIVSRQQVPKGDPLGGAFLVYDNQLDVVVRKDWGSDRNEGRERVGMGVLLALWLQRHPDSELLPPLESYYSFVIDKLQRDDGYVNNGVHSDLLRLYNFPWVASLHLEMSILTDSDQALDRFMKTVECLYSLGGSKFYCIGLPVAKSLALFHEKRRKDYDRLLHLYTLRGETLRLNGTRYPSHEVNYEQSIVAPATIMFLELYRATHDLKWLSAAKEQLRLLELFGGRQPDHRLHDIAIRHWDGYWFGKSRTWGDTMPHYWSVLTANAFAQYGHIVKDEDYLERADDIIRNNLSSFSPDGRASAAFLYPASVNGQNAYFADVYANDQDWALVYALQISQLAAAM